MAPARLILSFVYGKWYRFVQSNETSRFNNFKQGENCYLCSLFHGLLTNDTTIIQKLKFVCSNKVI